MLKHSKTKTRLHSNISPSNYNWIGTSAGVNGLGLNYLVRQHESQIELYIDKGKDCDLENIEVFNKLLKNKQSIEEHFRNPLQWDDLEGKRACRISFIIKGGYRDPEGEWLKIHSELVDRMISFYNSLKPFIKK